MIHDHRHFAVSLQCWPRRYPHTSAARVRMGSGQLCSCTAHGTAKNAHCSRATRWRRCPWAPSSRQCSKTRAGRAGGRALYARGINGLFFE